MRLRSVRDVKIIMVKTITAARERLDDSTGSGSFFCFHFSKIMLSFILCSKPYLVN